MDTVGNNQIMILIITIKTNDFMTLLLVGLYRVCHHLSMLIKKLVKDLLFKNFANTQISRQHQEARGGGGGGGGCS